MQKVSTPQPNNDPLFGPVISENKYQDSDSDNSSDSE